MRDKNVATCSLLGSLVLYFGLIAMQLYRHGLRWLWDGDAGIILLIVLLGTLSATILLSCLGYQLRDDKRELELRRIDRCAELEEQIRQLYAEIRDLKKLVDA